MGGWLQVSSRGGRRKQRILAYSVGQISQCHPPLEWKTASLRRRPIPSSSRGLGPTRFDVFLLRGRQKECRKGSLWQFLWPRYRWCLFPKQTGRPGKQTTTFLWNEPRIAIPSTRSCCQFSRNYDHVGTLHHLWRTRQDPSVWSVWPLSVLSKLRQHSNEAVGSVSKIVSRVPCATEQKHTSVFLLEQYDGTIYRMENYHR